MQNARTCLLSEKVVEVVFQLQRTARLDQALAILPKD